MVLKRRPAPEPLSPGKGRLALSMAEQSSTVGAAYGCGVEHTTTEGTGQNSSGMSVTKVQQWIISVLAFTVIEHFAAGLAVGAVFADDQDARVGLNVLAGVTGVLAVGAFRALHAKPLLSAWLLLGPLPGVVGAWFTFR